MKKLTVSFLLIAFYQLQSFAQTAVTIPGTEVRKITSTVVSGQEYELHLSLPANYSTSQKKYPVVYLMDSQWDFPLLRSLYGEQYYDGFIPELIVVGVTWGGIRPNADSLRARDYTPTNESGSPQSGGADKFLSFMETELFPFIETNYKADKNDRALMGCSLGGLFTMYALFTKPSLFQRYIAASPAFGWGREILYDYEKKYAENKANPPGRLYMIMGGVERQVPGFDKLAKHLADRKYKNLQVKSIVLENTGHSGTKAEGYTRGLQYVYERPSLTLAPAILNQYVGMYQAGTSQTAEMKNEGGRLVLHVGNNNKFPLFAASETDFYANSQFFNLQFKKSNGKIEGFQLNTFGNSQFVVKK